MQPQLLERIPKSLSGLFYQFGLPDYDCSDKMFYKKETVFIGKQARKAGDDWLSDFRCLRVLDEPAMKCRYAPHCSRCQTDGSYVVQHRFIQEVAVSVSRGTTDGDFFPQEAGADNYFVSAKLAEEIRRKKLTGVEFGEVTVMLDESGHLPKQLKVEVLSFTGKYCGAQYLTLAKGVKDACPYCDDSPIICPECGWLRTPCRKCGELIAIASEHHEGVGDRRLKSQRDRDSLVMFDGRKWDGSDFNLSGLITKRALDLFLSVHAAPFWYRPALMSIEGVSAQKLKLIRAAGEPVGAKSG